MEQFALHSGQREDGHVDHDDDRLAKGRGAAHLMAGSARDL